MDTLNFFREQNFHIEFHLSEIGSNQPQNRRIPQKSIGIFEL